MRARGLGGWAVALVGGAVAFGVADLARRVVLPGNGTVGIADQVGRVAGHGGLWLLAGLLMVVGSMVMLPGVARVASSVDGPGARLTRIGGLVLGAGLVASVGHAVAFYGMAGIYPRSGVATSALQAVEDESNRYPLFILLIVLFAAGLFLGPILLAVGLRRAGRVPVWVPVAAVVFAVTGMVGGVPAGVVGLLAAVATFVPMAGLGGRPGGQAAGDGIRVGRGGHTRKGGTHEEPARGWGERPGRVSR